MLCADRPAPLHLLYLVSIVTLLVTLLAGLKYLEQEPLSGTNRRHHGVTDRLWIRALLSRIDIE